jgi:diguanylate cyclase (GGDEF)-like protein
VSERVLIVQDSLVEAASLADVLSGRGYVTDCVPRGADAIREACGSAPPDIAVMDAVLPDMDGVQALRAMKEQLHPGFFPVILLSGRADADSRVSGLLGGADDVISKPCQGAEISARVTAMLRIKAAQDALRVAKLELERQSITDPLTGLFNRRYFQYRLDQEIERSKRHGDPVSLLLIDLDHFKKVNDRHGHTVGDAVLCRTAELLSGELRRLDVCTRWGGEEFAVIMPNTDGSGAATVAERVLRTMRARACFSALPIRGSKDRPESFKVTASLGLSMYPSIGVESAEQLIRTADAALYRAKDQGRDRICFAPEPDRAGDAPSDLLAPAACA